MFSRHPHDRHDDEIIGADADFHWTEDEVATERRARLRRRKRIGLSIMSAMALTFLLVGARVGLGLH
jgi:hypothetical protein